MRKCILALLILCLLPACALAEPLRVGMECDYVPYNWTQADPSDTSVAIEAGGYADGYDVQIAKRIAEGLGRELVIVKTEWDGLTMALTSGKIDAIIAGMSPTEERSTMIDFSDAYYVSELVVVVRKDGPYAQAKTLADLAGARITGQQNTFHYTVIDQIPDVKKETALASFPVMTVALTAGKIDGYVSERPSAISAMNANPDITFVDFKEGDGFVASYEDLAIAVGLAKGSPLKDEINAVIATITDADREQIMVDALEHQPLGE